jgi:hypothetical protein
MNSLFQEIQRVVEPCWTRTRNPCVGGTRPSILAFLIVNNPPPCLLCLHVPDRCANPPIAAMADMAAQNQRAVFDQPIQNSPSPVLNPQVVCPPSELLVPSHYTQDHRVLAASPPILLLLCAHLQLALI